jgi:hypothetical protein
MNKFKNANIEKYSTILDTRKTDSENPIDWLPFNIEPPNPSIYKFWNPRYFRIKLLEDGTENTKECNHRWKKYVGFTESYEYCEICDVRRK